MSSESYWIARVDELRADRDKAREELDDKTVALGEAEVWLTRYAHERDAASARAERAEAERNELTEAYNHAAATNAGLLAQIAAVRALADRWCYETGGWSEKYYGRAILAALDVQLPAEERSEEAHQSLTELADWEAARIRAVREDFRRDDPSGTGLVSTSGRAAPRSDTEKERADG